MAFDVSKFLALTVLIAGTGAACSGDDKDDPNAGGGKPTAGAPDKGGDAGATDKGGSSSGKAGEGPLGGEGGGTSTDGGTASVGGGTEGGAGGAGGESPTEPCLSNALLMGEGGAGGAGALDVDPSLEGLCLDLRPDCGVEDEDAPSYLICKAAKDNGTTIVAVKVAECLTALSAEGQCDVAKSTACFSDLAGKACENSAAAATCEAIRTNCTDEPATQAECEGIVNLLDGQVYEWLPNCVDPADEYLAEDFEGNCSARLSACATLTVL